MHPPASTVVVSTRKGFTLVELLVVVGIIAALAALLIPALQMAKWQARNTQCLGNLRQISLACSVYVSTYGAYPPQGITDPSNAFFWRPWWRQFNLPISYSKFRSFGKMWHEMNRVEGVYRCPLNKGNLIVMGYTIGSGFEGESAKMIVPLTLDYGYNAFGGLGAAGQPLGLGGGRDKYGLWMDTKETAVRSPSTLIAFGDAFLRSRNPSLDATLSGDATIRPETYFTSNTQGGVKPLKKQPTFISHRGRANRAFADGHIEREDMRKPFAATDAQLRRWNIDDLPHRDTLQD